MKPPADPERVVLSPLRTNNNKDSTNNITTRNTTPVIKSTHEKSNLRSNTSSVRENRRHQVVKGKLEIGQIINQNICSNGDKENTTPSNSVHSPLNRSHVTIRVKEEMTEQTDISIEEGNARDSKIKELTSPERKSTGKKFISKTEHLVGITPTRPPKFTGDQAVVNLSSPKQHNIVRLRLTGSKSKSSQNRMVPSSGGDQNIPKLDTKDFRVGTNEKKFGKGESGVTNKVSKKVWDSVKEFMSPTKSSARTPLQKPSHGPKLKAFLKEPYDSTYVGPTELHTLAYRCKAWDELTPHLLEKFHSNSISNQKQKLASDENGRNILHLLGLNEFLPSCAGNNTAEEITDFLLRENQLSQLVTNDFSGNFPFQDIVKKWATSEFEVSSDDSLCAVDYDEFCSPLKDIEFGNVGRSSSKSNKPITKVLKTNTLDNDIDANPSTIVELPDQVAYSLYISSAILDRLEEVSANEGDRDFDALELQSSYRKRLSRQNSLDNLNSDVHDTIRKFVDHFAEIDHLMTNFLLLDDEDRRFVFNCSLTRRAMMRPQSLGPWLIKLFNDGNQSKERASEYLSILSDTVAANVALKPKTGKLHSAEEEIYEKIESLDKLMPSMLMLDKAKIEDLASLPLISNVIGRLISTPFVATFLFADIILLLLLIFCFRKGVDGFLVGEAKGTILNWLWCANTFAVYFEIREFSKGIALTAMARNWSQVYWNFGTIVNMSSLFMIFLCVLIMRLTVNDEMQGTNQNIRSMFALATGLLWLRFLLLVKSINIKLATFVMAIVQITQDIFWYLAILVIIIVCFAQIFFTMLVPDECSATQGITTETPDCHPPEYYLRVYSIILGDWGLFEREEDFDRKTHALLVFVAFSFFIAIVLLNVLIAIISDSYKHCLQRSKHLFGRSRVFLLSELVAFRDISISHENSIIARYKRWHPMYWIRLVQSVDWLQGGVSSLLICSTGIIFFWCIAELFGVSRAYSDDSIFSNILKIFGTFALNFVVFIGFLSLLSGNNANADSNRLCRFITWLMLRLLGDGDDSSINKRDDSISNQLEDFSDRMMAIVTESEARILNEMKLKCS